MRTQPLQVGFGILLGLLLGVPFATWLVDLLDLSGPPLSLSTALSSPVFFIKVIGELVFLGGLILSASRHSWKILLLTSISTILITAAAEWIYMITEMTLSIILGELIAFIALSRYLYSLTQDL